MKRKCHLFLATACSMFFIFNGCTVGNGQDREKTLQIKNVLVSTENGKEEHTENTLQAEAETQVQIPDRAKKNIIEKMPEREQINIEKPVQRTSLEVIQKLCELGESSPVINEIYNNYLLYPEKMLAALANNPEMADFVAGYRDDRMNIAGSLTDTEKDQKMPLLLQWDARWGYQPYGTENNIGLAGCGPTCLSMVLFYFTRDEKLTPDRIAAYSLENGYYVEGSGTAWALMNDLPKQFGITVENMGISEPAMKSVLDNGGVIVCAMGAGDFTVAGHFIVIHGYDDEGLIVNDPNSVARSNKRWTFEELKPQIKNIWAYGQIGYPVVQYVQEVWP